MKEKVVFAVLLFLLLFNTLAVADSAVGVEVSISRQSTDAVKIEPIGVSSQIQSKIKAADSKAEIKEMNLVTAENKSIYTLRVQQPVKILGFFQATMETEAQVNAYTGEIESLEEPWWSFLAVFEKITW